MLNAITSNDGTWKGFMIALICLAPVILFLLSFEFSMFMIQVKYTYFKKQKWFEKGMIVDIVVLALVIVVAGIITGIPDWTDRINFGNPNKGLTMAVVTLWWFAFAVGISFIVARMLGTKYINKH